MKVLIIDDEAPIITMYSEKLTSEGFKVVAANDGVSGLEQARKEKPDVILLDLIMPKINGLDVLKELKNDPATAKIPVYLLTNIPQETGSGKGRQLGADGYLFKADTEPKVLVEALRALKR